jgi:hypothetical protein
MCKNCPFEIGFRVERRNQFAIRLAFPRSDAARIPGRAALSSAYSYLSKCINSCTIWEHTRITKKSLAVWIFSELLRPTYGDHNYSRVSLRLYRNVAYPTASSLASATAGSCHCALRGIPGIARLNEPCSVSPRRTAGTAKPNSICSRCLLCLQRGTGRRTARRVDLRVRVMRNMASHGTAVNISSPLGQ